MKNLISKKHNNIYIIEINREKQFNSVNIEVLEELVDILSQINNMTNINCVIITGSGNKSFIAGADIKNMINMKRSEALEFSSLGHCLTMKIENFNKPIIAAINGYALGGGCEIAMACHIRYAAENAIFGQPEVGLGLIAGWGGTQRLPKLVGRGIALELLLTGDTINADYALKIGLVNKVLKQKQLLDECIKLAEKISLNAPLALSNTISSVSNNYKFEKHAFADLFKTEDARHGMNSFINKLKPKFKGK